MEEEGGGWKEGRCQQQTGQNQQVRHAAASIGWELLVITTSPALLLSWGGCPSAVSELTSPALGREREREKERELRHQDGVWHRCEMLPTCLESAVYLQTEYNTVTGPSLFCNFWNLVHMEASRGCLLSLVPVLLERTRMCWMKKRRKKKGTERSGQKGRTY